MRSTPWSDDELATLARKVEGWETILPETDHAKVVLLAQEVLYLRAHIAHAARTIEAQTLDLNRLADCRREHLTGLVDRLRALTKGESVPSADDREYLKLLGRKIW